MKRMYAFILAAVMLLCCCVGCGKPQGDVSDPVSTPAGDVSTTTTEGATTTTEDVSADTTATGDVSADTTTADVSGTNTTMVKPTTQTPTNGSTTTRPSTNRTWVQSTTTTTTTTQVTTTTTTATKTTTQTTAKTQSKAKLNGVSLSEYTVVIADYALDYTIRAAAYICDEIQKRTGVQLEMVTDASEAGPFEHEIVVGETNRNISKTLNANTQGLEFALVANGGHVAMEGDYFVIAAAAYYFIQTYITGEAASTSVPATTTVCQPIVKAPKNYIFLIGDGMGVNQTKLFEGFRADVNTDYSDGERAFYGYSFPYMGYSRTDSLSGTTDSAAGGTALSTGYKTTNGRVGRDKDKKDLLSLTELAGSLGMATAVMSTESPIGATPASFSAHADSRDHSDQLYASQNELTNQYGTIINCQFDFYNVYGMELLEGYVQKTLTKLSENEKGFFLMYEEAHIDKHCHSNDAGKTFKALVRFNQAIGLFMEYAFYHPDTFVLITADHETGGLKQSGSSFTYSHGNHTSDDVPVFVYGVGGELFDGKTIENVQIPKTIARFWGQRLAADTDDVYPPLNP